MGVHAVTPVSPLPNMCWYVGFRGDERAPHASYPTQPGNTKSSVPKRVLGMAHDTAHPEPICFKPAEGREVGLVEAGLNQPGIADRHVDALLNPIGHRRLSPLRDTASASR